MLKYTRLKHFCQINSLYLKTTKYICDNEYKCAFDNGVQIYCLATERNIYPEATGKTEKESLQAMCSIIRGTKIRTADLLEIDVPYNIGL